VDSVLFRPLPYQDANRLVVILHNGSNPVAPANFYDWQAQGRSFASMGAAELWGPNLTNVDSPEHLNALRITPEILPMVGIRPLMGRVITPVEAKPGNEHVAVISYGFWQRRLGGDPSVLGREITLDGARYSVIGVMPASFQFAPFWATKSELWTPLVLANKATSRTASSLRIFAKLRDNVTVPQAQAEIATITSRLEQQFPGTNRNVQVVPLREKVVGSIRQPLLILLTAVGFLLLIACANVAHMLLARSAVRQKEVALRAALGATRGRLVRQFLTESVLLSILGAIAGIVLGQFLLRLFSTANPGSLPVAATIETDWRVLGIMLLISVATGIAFGLVPALQASTTRASEALKAGGRGMSEGRSHGRFRNLLLGSEFCLAFMLLIGAGLMIRSIGALQGIDPGFDARNLLTMTVSVAGTQNAEATRRAAFFEAMLARTRAVPGVKAAAFINHLPIGGDVWGLGYVAEGQPVPDPGNLPHAVYRVASPGYFETMRIAMRQGRGFTAQDAVDAPLVVVINEALAKQQWPGEDAIGKRVSLAAADKPPTWRTVVGVIRDVEEGEWAGVPGPEMYLPFQQDDFYRAEGGSAASYMTLVVRAENDAAALAPSIRAAIREIDRNIPISEVQTMEQVIAGSTSQPRLYLFLLVSFASLALVLASVGIYGVMSYAVSQRTKEIGVRMALGASEGQVLRMVLSSGMRVLLFGGAMGAFGALALGRVMNSFLYGVDASDPVTFVIVSVVLSVAALLASFVPARRAIRVDPMTALRQE
jgi:predicted permease